jgi:hypothetical protein
LFGSLDSRVEEHHSVALGLHTDGGDGRMLVDNAVFKQSEGSFARADDTVVQEEADLRMVSTPLSWTIQSTGSDNVTTDLVDMLFLVLGCCVGGCNGCSDRGIALERVLQ